VSKGGLVGWRVDLKEIFGVKVLGAFFGCIFEVIFRDDFLNPFFESIF